MRTFETPAGRASTTVWRGGVSLVDDFSGAWLALLERSENNEPFHGPDWVAAYLRAFKPPGELVLFTASHGDGLSAILPMVDHRARFCGIPVRKLTSATNVHCCRFDFARCAGPGGSESVASIWQAMRRENWDVVELIEAPNGGSVEMLLNAARSDGFPVGKWASIASPLVSLKGVEDVRTIPQNPHFRQNLGRRKRKAEALGPLRLSRFEDADPAVLERFFELEHSGWKGEQGTSIASSAETRRFYLEIASAAARRGYLSIYLLEFGKTLVAGHFGLTYKGRYYTPKVAYDERHAAYGPGHILIDLVLRDCVQRGLEEFDFLGPWMDWKAEWASGCRPHSHCYIFRPGPFGRALYSAKFNLMARLRKLAHTPVIAAFRERIGR